MTPGQYAILVSLVDDLIRDFSISHDVLRSAICGAIRCYVDEDMIEDLVNEEEPG